MYLPDCACDGDGDCAECRGTGRINRWRACDAIAYRAAIEAAGGIEALHVMSSYTRIDGDEWGTGRLIETTWGAPDPVVHHEDRDGVHSYWLWSTRATT